MPGGDRTGPLGMGPATGRGAGFCRGYGTAGFASRSGGSGSVGRGFGRGGYGRGWRNRFFATGTPGRAWRRGMTAEPIPTPVEMTAGERSRERRSLEQHAEVLRNELEAINQRLTELRSDREV